MKRLKVIIVDPYLKMLSICEIDNNLYGLQHAIGDHNIELVEIDEENILYLDEEGLYRENQEYFVINGEQRKLPIAGKAVILGSDHENGENKPVKMTLAEANNLISFHSKQEMAIMSALREFE